MSRQTAQVESPGQRQNIPARDTDRATGRQLSVAELQRALRVALATARTPAAADHPNPADPGPAAAGATEEPAADQADHSESQDESFTQASAVPVPVPVLDAVSPDWGANPVPVGTQIGERPVAVTRPVEPPPAAVVPGLVRFPVADLLRRRPRDRGREATRVLADRWPGHRRVVLASLTGGAGRSTAAALMSAAAVDSGVPVLLLDATGEPGSDLAARAGGAGTRRDWTRLTGTEARVDFAALRRRGGNYTSAGAAVVAIGGDAGSPPPAEAVAAGAAAAALSWPLVLVDIPHGRAAVRAAVRAGRVDMLVLVCRPDPAEITDSAEFLRDLAGGGELDCAQRALVAVRADRRGLPAAARRGLAGVCDTAAGTATVDHVARLTGRRNAAQGPAAVAAGRLLAAAAAVTPTRAPSGGTEL